MTGKLLGKGEARNIVAGMQVKNVGLGKVSLFREFSRLEVRTFTWEARDFLRDSQASGNLTVIPDAPIWTEPGMFSVFENHSWVESGETIKDEIIIALPTKSAVAHSLTLSVSSKGAKWLQLALTREGPSTWKSTAIVVVEEEV